MRTTLGVLSVFGAIALIGCAGGGPLGSDSANDDRVEAAKGGKPGKPGGGDPPSAYTLTDLGVGAALDLNSASLFVGGTPNGAAIWRPDGTLVLLTNGQDDAAYAIDEPGTSVVGTVYAGGLQAARRWAIDGSGAVTGTVAFQPLVGHDATNVSGTNDTGHAVGHSYPAGDLGDQQAVLWDATGTPRYLGDLPGRWGSWARGINNAGHVVGRSGLGYTPATNDHAVLWIVGPTSTTIVDLTPVGDTGTNMAMDVTEPSGGLVYIAGSSTVAGDMRPTIWTVDVTTATLIGTLRLDTGLTAKGINAVGQAVIAGASYGAVWNWATDGSVDELPRLSRKCSGDPRAINDDGIVAGVATVFAQGSCREPHAVIWTP